jgi:glycosyltransferase involved in cell wall biosynthesis
MSMRLSRILFVHSGSDLYGASRSLLRLSSRLAREGIGVTVVVPHDGPLVPKLQEKGVVVEVQKTLPVIERHKVGSVSGILGLLTNSIRSTFGLLRLIRRFRPDLVHTMTSVILSSGPAAKLAGIPHIWHVREFFAEFGGFWRYYQKYMLWFSARIICVSTPVAEQFDRSWRSERILVVHNGFPASEFLDVTTDRVEQFRAAYASPGVHYLIGVIGRIKFQRKGQEVFVRAAALLRHKFPDARFLCIGTPYPGNESHLANLNMLVQELDLEHYVRCTGDIEDIKAAIKGLDVVVLASAQPEPFGGVVIEAMALARPVVATGIGGSVEQVIDGVTGYLVAPGDSLSMADAIEKLLVSSDRRRIFGENGRECFLERFEFEHFYQTILNIYGQTLPAGLRFCL